MDELREGIGRRRHAQTCPFLRAEADGALEPPIEVPDAANRCIARGGAVPQSLRHQAAACLTLDHASCPRYLLADPNRPSPEPPVRRPEPVATALVRAEPTATASVRAEPTATAPVRPVPPQPLERVRRPDRSGSRPSRPRRPSRAIVAAILVLAASASASLGFVLVRGGLTMPVAPGGSFAVAADIGAPPTEPVVSTPSPIPAAPSTPEPTPTVTPTPTPSPTPTPAPTPTPTPRSDRYDFLEPCPTKPDCWIYTIRRGDALYALARYFGHPIETIYRLNPWTKVRGIRAGNELILPPPTR